MSKAIGKISKVSVLDIFADNIDKFIFWKDKDLNYLGCNNSLARFAGLASKEEIIGKSDYDMPWSKEEADSFRTVDRRVMESGQPELNFEEQQTNAHGETYWHQTSKIPLRNDKREIIGVLGWFSDITEVKKMEIQIDENNKALFDYSSRLKKLNNELELANIDLEKFTYAASHDLKTPLGTIVNYLGLIENKYIKDINEEAIELFGFVKNSGKRMSKLIDDILTYARTGGKDSVPEEVELGKIVQGKLLDLQSVIKAKGVKITINLPKQKVRCFPELIGLVFYNLINNGIKFNESHPPKINITASETADHWFFSVADNGIGIPEKYRVNVLDPFKRLHPNSTYEGSGIGLSTCKRVANIHNGGIWIESNPTGGTIFNFSVAKSL